MSPLRAVEQLPRIDLSAAEVVRIRNGLRIERPDLSPEHPEVAACDPAGDLVGILTPCGNGQLKTLRNLPHGGLTSPRPRHSILCVLPNCGERYGVWLLSSKPLFGSTTMRRREFLAAAATASASAFLSRHSLAADGPDNDCCHLTYARRARPCAPRETLAYVACIYAGTGVNKPDYLATVDVDPASKTYAQVVHRLAMPNVGDELHHFGWNACSSCHGDPTKKRRYLIVPGLAFEPHPHRRHGRSARAEAAQGDRARGDRREDRPLGAAHRALPGRRPIMISMLGDARGNGPGGFLLLDEIRDRRPLGEERRGHEVQLRLLVSAAAQRDGQQRMGRAEHVPPGLQARRREGRQVRPALSSGIGRSARSRRRSTWATSGMIPLEVRFHHDPDSTHGFVGAALSSTIWHWHPRGRPVEGREGRPGGAGREATAGRSRCRG